MEQLPLEPAPTQPDSVAPAEAESTDNLEQRPVRLRDQPLLTDDRYNLAKYWNGAVGRNYYVFPTPEPVYVDGSHLLDDEPEENQ